MWVDFVRVLLLHLFAPSMTPSSSRALKVDLKRDGVAGEQADRNSVSARDGGARQRRVTWGGEAVRKT